MKTTKAFSERREFLQLLMAGAGATAALAIAVDAAADEDSDPGLDEPKPPTGYHETNHIKTYYKVAAF